MIIDLDSHLREGYFLDEVYKLEGLLSEYSPVRVGNGKFQQARFKHKIPSLNKTPRRAGVAFNHNYMYDPDKNWRGGKIAERQAGGYDMERRLRDVKLEGIDKQVLFATQLSLPATAPGPLGAALCRAYNNWVRNLIRCYEDRFFPVAVLPAGCPEEMPKELRRCVAELGFKAAHLVPYCGARNLDDPAFYSYYAVAQELDVPLFCHPNTLGELTDRFSNFFPQHVLGRPMNCTPALIALVCGGMFELFPRLKVAFFECSAEWIFYWMHRMDDDYEWVKEDQAAHLSMPPSEYVKRNCYVTCEADEKFLPIALEEIGADHVCLATDYPHFDSEFPCTVSTIRERSDISERQKELILGANAARLLNI